METSVPQIPKKQNEILSTSFGNLKIGDKIIIVNTNPVQCILNKSKEKSLFYKIGLMDPIPNGVCHVTEIVKNKSFDTFYITDEDGSIFKVGDGPETYRKVNL
jgi:hypothetical protein